MTLKLAVRTLDVIGYDFMMSVDNGGGVHSFVPKALEGLLQRNNMMARH